MSYKIQPIGQEIPLVRDLANRPNDAVAYGGNGLSAAALKARFDALPLAVRDKLNELLAALQSAEGAACIGIPAQSYGNGERATTLAELLDALQDTGFAQLLMVQTNNEPCNLQQKLLETDETIARGITDIAVAEARLRLSYFSGEAREISLRTPETEVCGETLAVADGGRYVHPYVTTLALTLPQEALVENASLVAHGSDFAYCEDIVGNLPTPGQVCVVTYGEHTAVATAIRFTQNSVELKVDKYKLFLTRLANGKLSAELSCYQQVPVGTIALRVVGYLPCRAEVRLCIGGPLQLSLPPALYRGKAPVFSGGEMWRLLIEDGVIKAEEITTAEGAAAREEARLLALFEEVANGTY